MTVCINIEKNEYELKVNNKPDKVSILSIFKIHNTQNTQSDFNNIAQ